MQHQSTDKYFIDMLTHLLFFFFINLSIQQFSTSPTWIGNPYLETDSYQIITNFQDVSQSGGANITFLQAYSIPPKVAFAIIKYSGNDGLFDQDFFMKTVQVTQTKAQLFIFMQGATNIRVLSVMYLAVHPDFKYHLNTFNDVFANYSSGSLSLYPIDQYTNQTRIFVNYINYTQLCGLINTNYKYFGSNLSKNKIAVYLSGIFNYVRSSPVRDNPQVQFDIITQAINSSFFKLQVSVFPTYEIDLLKLSFIVMDIENIQTSKQYTIIYNTQRYFFDQDYYIPLQKQFFKDVFIGMLDFNTQFPTCTIDFNLVFQPDNNRIIVKKSVPHHLSYFPNCGLKSARLVTFFMKTWFCPDPFYYFNLKTDLCDDYCASYLYGNKTAGQCRQCPTGCVRCEPSNPDTCTVCDTKTDFRQLVNGSCQCMKGYYQMTKLSTSCTSCSSVISNCANCSLQSSFQCHQCQIGWYKQNDGSCRICTMIGCVSCVSPYQCLLCDESFKYTLVLNKTCQICPYDCNCDGYYLPKLLNQSNGNYYCTTLCGDGFKRQLQECDDGNSLNNDGCSQLCQIEKYWKCQNKTEMTCCIINENQMYLKIESVFKTKGENSFQVNLSLLPHLSFLTVQSLKQSLKTTLQGITIERSSIQVLETQKINIKYFYGSHAQKKQCKIMINIKLNQERNLNCSMQIKVSMKFYLDSLNNFPIMFFDQQSYQIQSKLEKIVDVAIYSSYVLMILSLISGKIVGLELFGVLQLAYFSLVQIEDLNLMLMPLIKLGASIGFRTSLFQNSMVLPNKVSYIEYDALFLNNCGFMLGLLTVNILVGLILYILSMFLQHFFNFVSLAKRLLKQFLLTLLVFNSFNFAFATGVHFKYANPNHQFYTINSIIASLSLILPLIISLALAFADSTQFGQFKNKFKNQPVCQLYFIFTILYRYSLGYFIAVKTQDNLSSLIVVSFSIIFLIYNFVNLPFKSVLHNYRANICHLSQLIFLLIANYYQSMTSNTSYEEKYYIFSPAYIDIAVIFASIGFSGVMITYELWTLLKFGIKEVNNWYKKTQKYQIKQIIGFQSSSGNNINLTHENLNQQAGKETIYAQQLNLCQFNRQVNKQINFQQLN